MKYSGYKIELIPPGPLTIKSEFLSKILFSVKNFHYIASKLSAKYKIKP